LAQDAEAIPLATRQGPLQEVSQEQAEAHVAAVALVEPLDVGPDPEQEQGQEQEQEDAGQEQEQGQAAASASDDVGPDGAVPSAGADPDVDPSEQGQDWGQGAEQA
jgi:hypothetical protein